MCERRLSVCLTPRPERGDDAAVAPNGNIPIRNPRFSVVFALHSSSSVPQFVLACTRENSRNARVPVVNVAGRSETAYDLFVFALGLPVGRPTGALLAQENHFSSTAKSSFSCCATRSAEARRKWKDSAVGASARRSHPKLPEKSFPKRSSMSSRFHL